MVGVAQKVTFFRAEIVIIEHLIGHPRETPLQVRP
jgi:hypothetical protein